MQLAENTDLIILSHHKCATNWIRSICRVMEMHGLIATYTQHGKDKSGTASKPTDCPKVLLNVNAFLGSTTNIDFEAQPVMHFVRDPRDAFVSNYWSWSKSHIVNDERILRFREKVKDLSVEDGLIELLQYFPMGRQLETWTDTMWDNAQQIRYEDMLADFEGTLRDTFKPVGLDISDEDVVEIKKRTSFEHMSKGRSKGQEDRSSHFRKGEAGDWKNYFNDEIESKFNQQYGDLCVRLGYI